MFKRENHEWRKRRRMREISFEKIEDIKEKFSFTYKEISELLGVSQNQLQNYKKTYSLPFSRYIAMRDAMLIHTMNRQKEEQEKILELFNT